ncbi:LppU/SCO3897 family protein [Streptomyces sp. NPDC002405]|uniref:LppU/SCO3897 family protein n=1 Tax=Streptomyces sp. NPDC001231 TaxID=3364549 RepID=UPI00368DD673
MPKFQGDPQVTTPPPPQGQNPYAQAPNAPMGQQPGQPGSPQQPYPPQAPYAPFPQQQGAPVPPPVPPKSGAKKALGIIGAVVFAIAILLVKFGIGWWFSQNDAETTSVGSCLHNKGTDSSPDLKEVDCSSSDAEFKVVQKFDGSSDEDKCEGVKGWTISYIQSGGGHDVVLCLKETQ